MTCLKNVNTEAEDDQKIVGTIIYEDEWQIAVHVGGGGNDMTNKNAVEIDPRLNRSINRTAEQISSI